MPTINQLIRKCEITNAGDSHFLKGEQVELFQIRKENDLLQIAGKMPATYHRLLMGITKASLYSDSFLSAASFIQTSFVLTDAAASGKVDWLLGLKENVIIGRLIPTSETARLKA